MAILGYQLVSTLIGISLLTKLSAHFSFTRVFVYGGIYRSLLPTNKEILENAGLTKIRSKGRRNNGVCVGGNCDGRSDPITFHFPRSTPFKLRRAEVQCHEISILPFYTDLVWLVDFSLCASFVLFINDFASFFRYILPPTSAANKTTSFFLSVHGFFTPSTVNLNLVWSLFIVWFAMGSLYSVLCVYLGSGENRTKVNERNVSSSEWPLLMVTGFSSFIAAMLCLSLDASFLDLRLLPAYGNLTFSFSPKTSNVSAISWGMFQACLASYAAVVGILFVFPSLQYGRIYVQTLRDPNSSWLIRVLFNLNLIAPQLTLLLWVVPLTARLPALLLQHAGTALGGAQMSTTLLYVIVPCARAFSSERICSLRLFFTLLTVILRIAMTKRHMQAFLDTAQTHLDRLNREPGRITNREVQRIVASVFHCFNFAALQYLAPSILLAGLAFSYKASTGTGWLPLAPQITVAPSSPTSLMSALEAFAGQDWDLVFTAPWFSALQHTREVFGELWESLRCQAGYVCQGVLGFTLFWCLAAWQAVAVTGVAYHRFVD